MEEKSRAQELSVQEISLIRELAQIRKEHKRELEYEKFDGYELPPRTQFSMLNKPAVSIKYGVMKFNIFYLLGSVLLATAVLSFLMQQSQGVEALQMLIGGFAIFMIPQVVGVVVVLLELAAVMLRQAWYI